MEFPSLFQKEFHIAKSKNFQGFEWNFTFLPVSIGISVKNFIRIFQHLETKL
jgi:hypothetical protein